MFNFPNFFKQYLRMSFNNMYYYSRSNVYTFNFVFNKSFINNFIKKAFKSIPYKYVF